MIYGMKMLQKLQITQHPQIGGYTSNSNQTTQHPQIWGGGGAGGLGRGDILNPKRVTKHPHMEGGGGETLQTPNELPSTHIRGEKHETNNYEFRWRDKDDKIPNTDGTNKQPNEKRLKKK